VEGFTRDPIFERQFQLANEIRFVEIDKVVAYQRMVNLGYGFRLDTPPDTESPEGAAFTTDRPPPASHVRKAGPHAEDPESTAIFRRVLRADPASNSFSDGAGTIASRRSSRAPQVRVHLSAGRARLRKLLEVTDG
jgi:hypothetical protein